MKNYIKTTLLTLLLFDPVLHCMEQSAEQSHERLLNDLGVTQ